MLTQSYHQTSVLLPHAPLEGPFGVNLALNLALSIWIYSGLLSEAVSVHISSQRLLPVDAAKTPAICGPRLSFQSGLASVVNLLTVADAGVCL